MHKIYRESLLTKTFVIASYVFKHLIKVDTYKDTCTC